MIVVVKGQKPVAFGSFIVRLAKATAKAPRPRAFVVPANDAELRKWQRAVRRAAELARAAANERPIDGPCVARMRFMIPRPPHHFEGGIRLHDKPHWPVLQRRDDVDKFVRAVLDAITGPIVDDDARIVRIVAEKVYVDDVAEAGVSLDVHRVTS
jgi:Holliday junction resolvase RusA-like endonuclease